MFAYEKLINAQQENNSGLCLGLDVDINKIPSYLSHSLDGLYNFNCNIIEATSDLVCAYKLNSAFYEQYGAEGIKVLKKTLEYIPSHLFTIVDAKRGDIGNSSVAYATFCFDYLDADSVTISPYMGQDSIEPFLRFNNKMAFSLALTSNPGSEDFQKLKVGDDYLYKIVVEKSMKWAPAFRLGYVVGATKPEELSDLRKIAKDRIFLIPGVGTQGGNIQQVIKANQNGLAMINVSRDIIYAGKDDTFLESARDKAFYYKTEINNARLS